MSRHFKYAATILAIAALGTAHRVSAQSANPPSANSSSVASSTVEGFELGSFAGKTDGLAEGQVVHVTNGSVVFYIAQNEINLYDEFKVFRDRQLVGYVVVESLRDNFAIAKILQKYKTDTNVVVGDKVELFLANKGTGSFSFFGGANFISKVGEFGGDHFSVGFDAAFYFRETVEFIGHLQIDSFGTDSGHFGKRSGAYMFGIGKKMRNLHAQVLLGQQDIITLLPNSNDPMVDPITGKPFTHKSWMAHDGRLAFMFLAQYDIVMHPLTRSSATGWAFGPWISFIDAFQSDPYPSIISFGLSAKLLTDF